MNVIKGGDNPPSTSIYKTKIVINNEILETPKVNLQNQGQTNTLQKNILYSPDDKGPFFVLNPIMHMLTRSVPPTV